MRKTLLDYVDRRGNLLRVAYFEEKSRLEIALYIGQRRCVGYNLNRTLTEGKIILLENDLGESKRELLPVAELENFLENAVRSLIPEYLDGKSSLR